MALFLFYKKIYIERGKMEILKIKFFAMIGMLGGFISDLYGGWTSGITTLLIFIGIDYFSGLILAGVFKKSNKTKNGALRSDIGYKGLFRKGGIFLVLLIAVRLDFFFNSTMFKNATIVGFMGNELLSIIENLGLMGVYIPQPIKNAIENLKNQEGEVK